MHILLTNDDGYAALGLRALIAEATARGHRVSVCAPDGERSAASHAITLRRGIRARAVPLEGTQTAYAADGTPADCARLGLFLIHSVDLTISGINNGANMGGACIYSGTVAAATEASMSGSPALAVSVLGGNAHEDEADFKAAAALALNTAEWMQRHPLPRGAIYNLNVPHLPLDQIKGIRAADLAPTYLDDPFYNQIETEDGIVYAYKHGVDSVPGAPEGSDVALTDAGYASLSILSWNLQENISLLGAEEIPTAPNREIERKYLIAYPDIDALTKMDGCVVWRIEQTYLRAPHGETRRVRRVVKDGVETLTRTFKRRIDAMSCIEDEAVISRAEYDALLEDADDTRHVIQKTRLRIPYADRPLEVDVYPFWQDRAIMEIELPTEDADAPIPAWIRVLREVTGQRAYSNAEMARRIPMETIK